MKDLELLDSNILVYAYDNSYPEKQKICKKLISECWKGNRKFAVSVQNLSEFYQVVTTKIEKPPHIPEVYETIQSIIESDNWQVINFDENTILSAIDINKEYNLHYFDALLAATMRENGVFKIYTEDEDFKKVLWLEVLDLNELK